MFKKRRGTSVEDQIDHANKVYESMIENIKNGIIDKDAIALAMSLLNIANTRAIQENKGHLIKY